MHRYGIIVIMLALVICLSVIVPSVRTQQPQGRPSIPGRCPSKCLCFSTTVRCMFLHLEQIPKVPTTTTILDLRFNKIRTIPPNSFIDLKNLNTLLLNNNHITKLQNGAFNGLTNLRYLYLYKNKIRHIENNVFNNLSRLEQLYLHYNDLGNFDGNSFKDLVSLERLFLHNNRLQSIPRGAFKNLSSLKRLRLDSNALVCDCQLMWLAKMVKEKQTRTQVAATCEYPNDLQGKSLTSLTDNEFQCKGFSPEITEEPSDVEINFGGTAYFTCKADGDPQPEVVWLHNNEVIGENSRYTVLDDGTLMIENTQEPDIGFFECMAKNQMGEAHSRKVKILMADEPTPTITEPVPPAVKPHFTQLPADRNVTEGRSAELKCQASGSPNPVISWAKNNLPLENGTRVKIKSDGGLLISETRNEDTAVYRCQASNHLGRVTATARLQVLVPPNFTLEPNDIYSSEGGSASFSCEADGEPFPVITWFKDDVLVHPTTRYTIFIGGTHLRIQDVKRSDEGNFICKAHNAAGAIETEASLYVRDKLAPIIKREPRDTTVSEGSDVTMPCEAHGLPTPTIIWRRDGQTMADDSKHKIESDGTLHIYEISANDAGIYECSASNYVGYATARAILTIQGEPVTHIGDQFFEESFAEARDKVNKAVNDTISNLFFRNRDQPPNPHELLRIFRFPQLEGRDIARIAETIEQTLSIVQRHVESGMKFNLTKFTYEDLLSPAKLRALADISGCLAHRKPVSSCDDMCFHLKYRTLDGSCNNLNHPMWGASLIGFRRSLNPQYENGFNTPVGWSKTRKYFGFFKPSSRVVSTRLLSTESISADHHCTHMIMQWGQFLDHDIDHALPAISTESFSTGIPCKRSCDYSAPCFPIEIPRDDPRIHTYRCMEFARSSAVCGSGITSVFFEKVLPREQINQLTSFIDASQIYSSSNPEMRGLRNLTLPNGQLRLGIPSRYGNGKPLLPFSNGSPIDCRRDHTESAIDCFLAGDIRANEQLGLLAMHTIWFREHNRIASELQDVNPHWDGDTVFHESRKIIGGMVQHITYEGWLPHIIGPIGMEKLGPYTGYKPNVDPTVSNVFATAALRFGHTLINPELQRLDTKFHEIPEGNIPLHKSFFSPWRLVEEGGIDPILRGLFAIPAKMKMPGQFMNSELTEKLFRSAHEVALDLAAMNVQRGRDHGLPPYVEWRKFCNLSVPESFNDLESEITSAEIRTKLRLLYGHPGNVDLFVGAILEDPLEGARIGPTMSCLLIDQFRRLRDGDRFWYENPWVFKPEQLAQIKQSSLSRVLCDNGDNITDATHDVFILPQEQSPAFVPCTEIPKIDLRLWSECCTDCKNAGFFSNLQRPSQRFRRDSDFSYREDRDHYLDSFDTDRHTNSIPRNISATDQYFYDSKKHYSSNDLLGILPEKPQRRNDRFLSGPFKPSSKADNELYTTPTNHIDPLPADPLEGYVKDVTEERIEGVEALVEQLSNTVLDLTKKIRRLEKLHKLEPVKKPQKTCIDESGTIRTRGQKWFKDDCVVCICRPKGVRCRVIKCPDVTCANPVRHEDKCCPTC